MSSALSVIGIVALGLGATYAVTAAALCLIVGYADWRHPLKPRTDGPAYEDFENDGDVDWPAFEVAVVAWLREPSREPEAIPLGTCECWVCLDQPAPETLGRAGIAVADPTANVSALLTRHSVVAAYTRR